jgi:outer membrane receptor for ferrienterochelin and colicins
VINILTYDPLSDSIDAASVRAGTGGYVAGSAVTTLRVRDTASVRLSAGAWRANEFSTAELPAYFAPYDDSPHQFALSADGRLKVAPGIELTAEATASGATSLSTLPVPIFATASYHTYSAKLSLSAGTSGGLLNVQTYFNHDGYVGQSAGFAINLQNDVYVIQASDFFKLGSRHTLRFGVEYRHNELAGGAPKPYADQTHAASATWNWQVASSVNLTSSVRGDYVTLNFKGPVLPGSPFVAADYDNGRLSALSFNSGLVYAPTARDTLRLMVVRGMQVPSLVAWGLRRR